MTNVDAGFRNTFPRRWQGADSILGHPYVKARFALLVFGTLTLPEQPGFTRALPMWSRCWPEWNMPFPFE